MLNEINKKLDGCKFVPDLKKVVAELFTAFMDYSAMVDERLTRLEVVALEHAKLIDPAPFLPAEAATDAPAEESTTEDTEDAEKKPPGDATTDDTDGHG